MYVAISQDLTNRVRDRIRKMRDTEVQSACPELEKRHTLDASYIFNLGCWGSTHMHLIDVIPGEWLASLNDATIKIVGDDNVVKVDVTFLGMTRAVRRPATDYWNRSDSSLTVAELNALPDGTAGKDECLTAYAQACERHAIMERWSKIENELTGFLKQCKSLNEAIKLLPSVKMYVDKDDLERLERKVERKPREELTISIDTETITASAVAARLVHPQLAA
jgi:hypothetical protein